MKLDAKVYMVGAHALGMKSAMTTVRNFPKPPAGASTASTSPPTLFPLSKPAFHDGTAGAAAAKAAPSMCPTSYDSLLARYVQVYEVGILQRQRGNQDSCTKRCVC